MGLVRSFFSGIYNLIVGLTVTGKHLGRHAITLQYPKERWPMPERSRGVVVLLSDQESGKLNCTACMLCMRACPSAAIMIEREKNENKRWEPTKFVIDNTICCFCGQCEEACNFDAIKLAGKYEFSVFDQGELHYNMEYLGELGKDVPYTPRRKKAKKKPPAKPAPKKEDEKKPPETKSEQMKEEKKADKPEGVEAKKEDEKKQDAPAKEDKPAQPENDKTEQAQKSDQADKDKKDSGN
jgi:NADH-quinone oxidoreductase subunit I